jgi:hypothetical protein
MALLDFEGEKRPSRFRLKPAKLFIALGSVCSLVFGYTFAANINLNNNQAVEFGQGVVQTVACDQDGLILTPYSSFINGNSNFTPITLTADSDGITNGRLLYTTDIDFSSIRVGDSVTGSGIPEDSFITNISDGGVFAINNSYSVAITSRTLTITRPPGRFLLNEIELADIDAENCANKALTIKVYNSTSSSPLATYEVFSTGVEVTSASGQIEIDVDIDGNATMFLTIEEPTVSATDVYRITIESKDLMNLSMSRFGIWAGALECGPSSADCLIPTDAGEEFYCADGVCNIAFLPVSDFLQLQAQLCEASAPGECDENYEAANLLSSSTWSLSENNSEDPDLGWEILITTPGSFGPFQNNIHLSGQILYANEQYAVFRWYVNTEDDPTEQRSYIDLIISFGQSLPTSNLYDGPSLFNLPFEVPLYELSWNYLNGEPTP